MEPQQRDVLFLQLILQHSQIGMMSMGKIKNPMTNEAEVNLEYAKITIDTLDVLKEKTKGNLNEYEEQYLDQTLQELKLAYVEASK